jgi:hypothetical protein
MPLPKGGALIGVFKYGEMAGAGARLGRLSIGDVPNNDKFPSTR